MRNEETVTALKALDKRLQMAVQERVKGSSRGAVADWFLSVDSLSGAGRGAASGASTARAGATAAAEAAMGARERDRRVAEKTEARHRVTRIIRRASSSRFGKGRGRRAKSNRIELHAFVTPGYGSLAKVGDDELFEGFHALDHGRGHHRGGVAAKVFFSGALVKVVDDEVDEFEQVGGLAP